MKKWLPIGLLACCPTALAFDEEALVNLLERARQEMNMPGLRAAVRFTDGRILRAAVGLADKEAARCSTAMSRCQAAAPARHSSPP